MNKQIHQLLTINVLSTYFLIIMSMYTPKYCKLIFDNYILLFGIKSFLSVQNNRGIIQDIVSSELISEIAKKAFDLELNSGNFIYGNQHIADAILKMLTAFYPLLFIFILLLKSDLVTDTDFRIRIRIFTADTDGYRRISAGILVLSVSISVSMTRSD